jgi:hypothetical protein
MPDITTSDLARFARQSDVELRVIVNGEGQPQIDERHGWLGGRVARGLKIAFGKEDRTTKQQEYLSAKREVLKALKKAYGDEIGERAFRAGVGEMRDGQHRTSSDHPITGRHIQKMIEVAEREIAQIEGVRDFGRNGFRDQTGRAMTERATAFWMNKMAQGQGSPNLDDVGEMQQIEQSPSGRFKVGDLHYGLRGERVQGQRGRMAPGLTMTSSVGRDLIEDIDRKFQQEPDRTHGFWTIDLEMSGGGPALGRGRKHVIGIFVDRSDPNTIRVFDANRREVAIPRDQFAGWLSAHIKDVYGTVSAISLYRAEEKRIGIFERTNDRWTCDELCVFSDEILTACKNEATVRMGLGPKSGVDQNRAPPMYRNFWKDIDRSTVTIARLNEPSLLVTEQTTELLMPLVDGDGDSLKALSCMLDQSMPNALMENMLPQFKVQDDTCLPDAKRGRINTDISILRNGNDLEISYTTVKFLNGFVVYDPDDGYVSHGTSHWTDRIVVSTTIKVSIDELHQAGIDGRVPQFEFLAPPNARLQVQNYTGVIDRSVKTGVETIDDLEVAISRGENLPGRWDQFEQAMMSRVRGQQVIRVTNDGIPIAPCLRENAPSLTLQIGQDAPQGVLEQEAGSVHERFLGLVEGDQYRVSQLSRLIDTTIVDDFCEELGRAVGASPREMENSLEGGYRFSLQTVQINNESMVEITMSQNLDTSILFPPTDGPNRSIQGSMTIRVPFSALDSGHPENFTVVTRPHFEIRQDV